MGSPDFEETLQMSFQDLEESQMKRVGLAQPNHTKMGVQSVTLLSADILHSRDMVPQGHRGAGRDNTNRVHDEEEEACDEA